MKSRKKDGLLKGFWHNDCKRPFGNRYLTMFSILKWGFVLACFLFIQKEGALRAQEFSMYHPPVEWEIQSASLGDKVTGEIVLPKGFDRVRGIRYPVLFILDRQNPINYRYQLQTVDYLTGTSSLPPCVLVGIDFPFPQRNIWTLTDAPKGKADALIQFMRGELTPFLEKQYPVLGEFRLVLGHSRTAIFAQYALSASKGFFSGAIASSSSFFDFGDTLHQAVFESYLDSLAGSRKPSFLWFSAGTEALGDQHEASCNQLADWFRAQALPPSFHWQYLSLPVGHMGTPGGTVPQALVHIFQPSQEALALCFQLQLDSLFRNKFPWKEYRDIYAAKGGQIGLDLQPDLLFFNSIASGYLGDYSGIFGEMGPALARQTLVQALEFYPEEIYLLLWLSEICLDQGDTTAARDYWQQARQLVPRQKDLDPAEQADNADMIKALGQALRGK